MGLVFDQKCAAIYDAWYQSAQGRAVDRALEPMIVNLSRPLPGERVLDIGCGSGHHMIILSKLGLDVTGVDYSPYMIKAARKRLGHRCELKTAPAEELPFDDNEFQTAFLINTLEFLDNPVAALREAGRVSKNRVFVGVFNSLSWDNLVKKGRAVFGNALFAEARFYSLWRLRLLLRQAFGDADVAWGSVGPPARFFGHGRSSSGGPDPVKRSPFGTVLGMSVTLRYRFTTQGLPLKATLKKVSGPSIADPAGMEARDGKSAGR